MKKPRPATIETLAHFLFSKSCPDNRKNNVSNGLIVAYAIEFFKSICFDNEKAPTYHNRDFSFGKDMLFTFCRVLTHA